MLNSSFITLPGKYVLERKMEAITNNLANASTAGYKSSRPSFSISSTETATTEGGGPSLPQTTFTNLDFHIHFDEAPLVQTGNGLDVAIQGSGFFVVSTEDGVVYTRNGQFTLNKDKKLVTMDGSPVMGQSGEITLDGKEIVIEGNGSVYLDKRVVGTLKIVDFKDKTTLRNQGKSCFVNTDPDNGETSAGKFVLKSGFYETSNVNVMGEMVEMMSAMRAYESYTKVEQALNDVMTKLVDIAR